MGDYICTFTDGSEALVHYGVLGMRWGVRHDDKYKSQKDKIMDAYKAQRKAAGSRKAKAAAKTVRDKAIAKAKVDTANRLYSMNSREANRRIQTRSMAKTLGTTALLGSYGQLHYDRARSEGKGIGRSAVRGILAKNANIATMGIAGLANYGEDRAMRKVSDRSGDRNRSYIKGPGYENGQGNEKSRKRFKD